MREVWPTPGVFLSLACLTFLALACKKEEAAAPAPPPDLTGMIPYSDAGHGLTLNVPKNWTTPKRIFQEDQSIVSEMPGDLGLRSPGNPRLPGRGVILGPKIKTDPLFFQQIYDAKLRPTCSTTKPSRSLIPNSYLTAMTPDNSSITLPWADPPNHFVDVFISRPQGIVRLRIAFPLALAYKYSSQADAIVKTIKFQ